MKNPTPLAIARISALIISLSTGLILFLIKIIFPIQLSWFIVILIPVFVAICGYFVFYYLIETFLYRKIKLIYKSIYDTKIPKKEKVEKFSIRDDIIKETEKEVLDWQRNNMEEVRKQKKLDRYRTEFLGNVFHELKTPIFNIQGYLETLIDGGINDPNINVKFMKKARKNVNRLTEIVDDLQMIANLEDGSFSITEEKFDIHRLVCETLDSMEFRAQRKGIKLEIKEGCDKSFFVVADREMIQQVLNNLLTNSIKYGKENGRTQVGLYDMNDNILVEISDNGLGIDQQHLSRIFERFYRADKNRSRQIGGSGLGLSIVKHIIEAHQQTVNVRSTPGLGSTFGFTLRKA
jgi:two-component system phosphate regulon sensor histidine kinase PhoR